MGFALAYDIQYIFPRIFIKVSKTYGMERNKQDSDQMRRRMKNVDMTFLRVFPACFLIFIFIYFATVFTTI